MEKSNWDKHKLPLFPKCGGSDPVSTNTKMAQVTALVVNTHYKNYQQEVDGKHCRHGFTQRA